MPQARNIFSVLISKYDVQCPSPKTWGGVGFFIKLDLLQLFEFSIVDKSFDGIYTHLQKKCTMISRSSPVDPLPLTLTPGQRLLSGIEVRVIGVSDPGAFGN